MSSKKSGGLATNPLLARTESVTVGAEPIAPETSDPLDARTPASAQTRVRVDTQTSKFTFYFTDTQLDRLDDIWGQLRRSNRRTGQRLTKSHVVRVALDRLLDDFDRDPERVIRDLRQSPGR